MKYHERAVKQLKENSAWYLALGLGHLLLGSLFIFYSFTATVISMLYLGAMLVIVGVFEGIKATKMNQWGTFFLHVFLAILYGAMGIFIMINPIPNAITFTLFLAVFFVISGVVKTMFALTHHLPHKPWVLLNGILTTILGILIWQQWPYSGIWVIGMFCGIDMLFTGLSWIQLSMMAKEIKL